MEDDRKLMTDSDIDAIVKDTQLEMEGLEKQIAGLNRELVVARAGLESRHTFLGVLGVPMQKQDIPESLRKY